MTQSAIPIRADVTGLVTQTIRVGVTTPVIVIRATATTHVISTSVHVTQPVGRTIPSDVAATRQATTCTAKSDVRRLCT